MSWDYRLLAHEDGKDWFFQIHRVHYKNGKPHSFSMAGATIGGNSNKDIKWSLEKIKEGLEKPILSVVNFPNEWKE